MNILLYDRWILASFLFFSESSCGIHCILLPACSWFPTRSVGLLRVLACLFPKTISLDFLAKAWWRISSYLLRWAIHGSVSMAPVYTLSLMTKFLNLIWYAWTFVDMIFCRSFHMCTPKNNRSKCYMGEYRLSSLTLTRLSSLCLVFASLIFKLLVLSRGKKVWFIYNLKLHERGIDRNSYLLCKVSRTSQTKGLVVGSPLPLYNSISTIRSHTYQTAV